jgi:hypothetical protein
MLQKASLSFCPVCLSASAFETTCFCSLQTGYCDIKYFTLTCPAVASSFRVVSFSLCFHQLLEGIADNLGSFLQ